MDNKDLFKKTFSNLKVTDEVITEVIKMKDNKKVKKFPAKGILVAAACLTTILCTGVVANAATNGELVGSILKVTDHLGITHTYTLEEVDDDMVIWSSTDENGDQNEFYCLESSDPGKTDEEKVKDTEEYLKSDEYKLDSERHSIMDEYAKKEPGKYQVTDSQGNEYTVVVEKDGNVTLSNTDDEELSKTDEDTITQSVKTIEADDSSNNTASSSEITK